MMKSQAYAAAARAVLATAGRLLDELGSNRDSIISVRGGAAVGGSVA
jgi:hypothetical protein